MLNVIQSLQAVTPYPIPLNSILNAVEASGLVAEQEATMELRATRHYKRALSDIYAILSEAPNVSQGGVSYSFTSAEKAQFKRKASELLAEAEGVDGSAYGWQGEDF